TSFPVPWMMSSITRSCGGASPGKSISGRLRSSSRLPNDISLLVDGYSVLKANQSLLRRHRQWDPPSVGYRRQTLMFRWVQYLRCQLLRRLVLVGYIKSVASRLSGPPYLLANPE